MPLGITEEYSEREKNKLYSLFLVASHDYPIDSEEFALLMKAAADMREQM
jgi:hypothetical protein